MPDLSVRVGAGLFPASRIQPGFDFLSTTPSEALHLTDAVLNARVSPLLMTLSENLHTSEAVTAVRSDAGAAANLLDVSFTSAQGWTSDVLQPGTGCSGTFAGVHTGTGESGDNGGWHDSGSCDRVFATANHSGGAGGRGFRHYRGDGENSNGGGIKFLWAGSPTEIWIRYYFRYPSGFAWGSTINAKDLYIQHDGAGLGTMYWGFHEGSFGGHIEVEGGNRHTSLSWADVMGGSTGDGAWHCCELHMKANTGSSANGELRVWLDDVLVQTWTDVKFGNSGARWEEMYVGENQNDPNNGAESFTDYDDIAISSIGRIGPINNTLTATVSETLHVSDAVTVIQGAAADLFNSSFTTAEGWNADVDNTNFASPGATVGSVTNWETGTAPLDSVLSVANYSGAGARGGRGHRHYRSGDNVMGGGLRIVWSPVSHLWFRYMIRYSSGFTWSGGNPSYTKDWYDDSGNGFTIGFMPEGPYGIHIINGSNNYPSNTGPGQTWTDWYPSGTADGSWKCIEGEMNKSGGILRMWINNVLTMDRSGTSVSSASDFEYMVTNNHNLVSSSNSYTDYDDIAVSSIGRIGSLL